MFGWFRRTPDAVALAQLVGELCVALRDYVRSFADQGDFSADEVSQILEFLPQAIHAMALERLGVNYRQLVRSGADDPIIATVDQFFEDSKAAMLATRVLEVDEALAREWLREWGLTSTIFAALEAPDAEETATPRRHGRDFLIWKSFADYWAPFDADEFRTNHGRAVARSHKVAFLGKIVREAIEKA